MCFSKVFIIYNEMYIIKRKQSIPSGNSFSYLNAIFKPEEKKTIYPCSIPDIEHFLAINRVCLKSYIFIIYKTCVCTSY